MARDEEKKEKKSKEEKGDKEKKEKKDKEVSGGLAEVARKPGAPRVKDTLKFCLGSAPQDLGNLRYC